MLDCEVVEGSCVVWFLKFGFFVLFKFLFVFVESWCENVYCVVVVDDEGYLVFGFFCVCEFIGVML